MKVIAIILATVVLYTTTLVGTDTQDYQDYLRVTSQCGALQDYGAEVKWYEIEGETVDQIANQLQIYGPQDFAGKKRYAMTEWYVKWRWDSSQEGLPKYESSRSTLKLTVTLPRLSKNSMKNPDISNRWERYLANVIKHECVHVGNGINAKAEIDKSLIEVASNSLALDYKVVNKKLFAIISRFQHYDIIFDEKTENGRIQGADWR